LKTDGSYLNLDGGFDSRRNRKAIFVTAQVAAVMRGIDRSRASTSQRVDGTA
jgi:hypothetical protein